jgi:hypothetical protein
LSQDWITVIGHQLRKRASRLHNPVSVLVEHLKKIAFSRQQLGKQHHSLQEVYVRKMTI